jgi:hypothetical protein
MIVEHADGAREAPPQPDFDELEKVATENLEKGKQLIIDHPLAAAGGALAIGAVLGSIRRRGKGGLLGAAVTGIVMTLVRDAVVRRISTHANHWIDQKSREEASSRQHAVFER